MDMCQMNVILPLWIMILIDLFGMKHHENPQLLQLL